MRDIVKDLYIGDNFSACCGSYLGGKIGRDAKLPLKNPKGIALYEGTAPELDSKRTVRTTIQTSNGPITIMMAKPL